MTEYKSQYTGEQIDAAVATAQSAVQFAAQTLTDEQQAQARTNIAAASQKEVDALSEEIVELRTEVNNEATASGSTVTVKAEADSSMKIVSQIAADGKGVSRVNLTHSGKNLARLQKNNISTGVVVTYDGLSAGHAAGAGASSTYININAYTMRSTSIMLSVVLPENMTFVYTQNKVWKGEIKSSGNVSIMGNVGDVINGYFQVLKNVAVDGDFAVQIEIGTQATEYETAKETTYSVTLPETVVNGEYNWATGVLTNSDTGETAQLYAQSIFAYGGTDILWSDTGNTTVTYKKSSGNSGSGESAGGGTSFDYKAYNLPILYLSGDITLMYKDDAVDLAYVYGSMKGTASVKWQGSSSIAYPKKNYTIKFDTAFEAKEGWGAQKKYCTKANWIDFSHSRNLVSANLWGQICEERGGDPLADCPNYGAVDGFPIVIVINDEFMGVYTFNIPKDGWMANLPTEGATQEAILCADVTGIDATRLKGPATLDGDFEVEYITDEDNTEWAKTSLNALINACVNSDGSDLDTTIAAMLDWDRAIDYYIFTVLLRGDDMVDKNYLLIKRGDSPWLFGGYDMDCTFGLYWDGSKFIEANILTKFAGVAETHRLMNLIYTYKRDELIARYKHLRNTVMSEDNIALAFLNFAGVFPRPLMDEDNRKWPTIPNTNVNNVQQAIDWYRRRCIVIDKEINALQPQQ